MMNDARNQIQKKKERYHLNERRREFEDHMRLWVNDTSWHRNICFSLSLTPSVQIKIRDQRDTDWRRNRSGRLEAGLLSERVGER